jgi:hypothetical protein
MPLRGARWSLFERSVSEGCLRGGKLFAHISAERCGQRVRVANTTWTKITAWTIVRKLMATRKDTAPNVWLLLNTQKRTRGFPEPFTLLHCRDTTGSSIWTTAGRMFISPGYRMVNQLPFKVKLSIRTTGNAL